jgi:hypothetical protein
MNFESIVDIIIKFHIKASAVTSSEIALKLHYFTGISSRTHFQIMFREKGPVLNSKALFSNFELLFL